MNEEQALEIAKKYLLDEGWDIRELETRVRIPPRVAQVDFQENFDPNILGGGGFTVYVDWSGSVIGMFRNQ